MNTPERRTFERWTGAWDVVLDAETQPPRMIKGQLKDISQTGLCLHAREGLPADTHVCIRLDTPGEALCDSHDLLGRGVVVGSADARDEGGLYAIRLRFLNVDTPLVESLVLQLQVQRLGT